MREMCARNVRWVVYCADSHQHTFGARTNTNAPARACREQIAALELHLYRSAMQS